MYINNKIKILLGNEQTPYSAQYILNRATYMIFFCHLGTEALRRDAA